VLGLEGYGGFGVVTNMPPSNWQNATLRGGSCQFKWGNYEYSDCAR